MLLRLALALVVRVVADSLAVAVAVAAVAAGNLGILSWLCGAHGFVGIKPAL